MKNKRYNTNNKRRNNKKPLGIPRGTDRMDKELMSEIQMFYNLTKSIEATSKAYHVTPSMVKYALRNACSFDSLQNEISIEKEELK